MKYVTALSEALVQVASVFISLAVIVFVTEYLISASVSPLRGVRNFIDRKFNSTQAA